MDDRASSVVVAPGLLRCNDQPSSGSFSFFVTMISQNKGTDKFLWKYVVSLNSQLGFCSRGFEFCDCGLRIRIAEIV